MKIFGVAIEYRRFKGKRKECWKVLFGIEFFRKYKIEIFF